MITNTHHTYLPKLFLSLPYHSIQFSKFHLIINIPSLSRSPTYLLLITTVLKQSRHELNDTVACVVLCVVLCTVSGGFMLDCIWNYNVQQFALCCVWCCVQ